MPLVIIDIYKYLVAHSDRAIVKHSGSNKNSIHSSLRTNRILPNS